MTTNLYQNKTPDTRLITSANRTRKPPLPNLGTVIENQKASSTHINHRHNTPDRYAASSERTAPNPSQNFAIIHVSRNVQIRPRVYRNVSEKPQHSPERTVCVQINLQAPIVRVNERKTNLPSFPTAAVPSRPAARSDACYMGVIARS